MGVLYAKVVVCAMLLKHLLAALAAGMMLGRAFDVTTTLVVVGAQLPAVTVTVYVLSPRNVGVTITDDESVLFRSVAGDQE